MKKFFKKLGFYTVGLLMCVFTPFVLLWAALAEFQSKFE
jgi:hypothetical protein